MKGVTRGLTRKRDEARRVCWSGAAKLAYFIFKQGHKHNPQNEILAKTWW